MRIVLLCIVCCLCGVLRAEGVAASMCWPGWEVEASEYYDAPGYPISWMCDGNPATAWVYHYQPDPRAGAPSLPKYAHGTGATITITRSDPNAPRAPVTLDRIDLTNGYVKSSAAYWRNNRIRAVRVRVQQAGGKGMWSKEFTLRETRAMQRLSLPRLQAQRVSLEVLAVDIGWDDDLCISEIALLNTGRRLPWTQTPYMVQQPSGEIIDSMAFYIVDSNGQRVEKPEWKALPPFTNFAWQPHTTRVLLSADQDLFLYDGTANRIRSLHRFSQWISLIGWLQADTAVICTGDMSSPARTQWFRFPVSTGRVAPGTPVSRRKDGDWPFLVNGS